MNVNSRLLEIVRAALLPHWPTSGPERLDTAARAVLEALRKESRRQNSAEPTREEENRHGSLSGPIRAGSAELEHRWGEASL